MICPEASNLLDLYHAALKEFHDSRLRLPDAGDYECCFSKLRERRGAYWKHVQEHGCRTASVRDDPDMIEESLREDAERAHASYRETSETDSQGYNSDPAHHEKAQVRNLAREQYKIAITRFINYVLHGNLPGDIRG
jgi:hypothetical protein